MASKNTLNPFMSEKFRELISRRFGIYIRERDLNTLREVISRCMETERIHDPAVLLDLLRKDKKGKSRSWKLLISEIANNESYFFRDKGQFSLLKHYLLPELIRLNSRNRSIRIWSAGCSRGEEAYSIAIILREVIPDLPQWDILILATDIDQEALEQGQKGEYSSWSLRGIDEDVRKKYFRKKGKWWKLSDAVKTMVRFSYYNLLAEEYPELFRMDESVDLIFCRNVFIYFEQNLVEGIMGKFERLLKPGGYLFTAHAEIQQRHYGRIKPALFPESVVFRKEKEIKEKANRFVLLHQNHNNRKKTLISFKDKADYHGKQTTGISKRPSRLSRKDVDKKRIIKAGIDEIRMLYGKADYHAIIERLGSKQLGSLDDESLLWLAQSYANVGEDAKAIKACGELIRRAPLKELPYCIQAQIYEERGEVKQAMQLLDRVIYVNPEYICGYLNLAALHEREGNLEKAQSLRRIALGLLRKRSESEPIEPYQDMTAGEIRAHLEKLLR